MDMGSSSGHVLLLQSAGNLAIQRVVNPRVQRKARVSVPGDAYEEEADRVSQRVLALTSAPMVQRKCACGGEGECDECKRKAESSLEINRKTNELYLQRAAYAEAAPAPVASSGDGAAAAEGGAAPAAGASPTPTPGLIVEDSTTDLGTGQMKKSEFLGQLRGPVTGAAQAAIAGTPWSALGSVAIGPWFQYYAGQSAQQLERTIQRSVPGSAGVTHAGAYIPMVSARVLGAVGEWARTGALPPDVPASLPGIDLSGGGLLGTISGAVSSLAEGANSLVSKIGGMLFKSREGGARVADDPRAIQAQLGSGETLESGLQGRMSSAFGYDFSGVRVHKDNQAAQLSADLNARAFTIGRNVAFGAGEYHPGTPIGDALIAHELAHVAQQAGFAPLSLAPQQTAARALEEDADRSAVAAVVALWSGASNWLSKVVANAMPSLRSGLRLQRCSAKPTYGRAEDLARSLSDTELARYIDQLRAAMANTSDRVARESMQSYISSLESAMERRRPASVVRGEEEGAYPSDIALFSSYLLRGRYIDQVATLLPGAWRSWNETQITAWLNERFTEEEVRVMFLEKYDVRAAIKLRFRKANIVMAVAIGLIWARDNIAEGEWGTAAAKVGGSAVTAWAFNRILFARDPSSAAIMASKGANWGRWFTGAARTNRVVNFLVRRVGAALLIWDLKDLFMSGGYGGPNIPFDLIQYIDIDDPSTWREPDQALLDLGFNLWYRQTCTTAHPEACGVTPIYLGKIEGSALTGVGKLLDVVPHDAPRLRERLYRIEGKWDFASREACVADNIIVIATGRRGPELVSLGRGHYRETEVVPANRAAVNYMDGSEPRFVPEYLLNPLGAE